MGDAMPWSAWLAVLTAAGCGASVSASEAQEHYRALESEIGVAATTLQTEMAMVPRLTSSPPPCDRGTVAEQNACAVARANWFEVAGERDRAFQARTLPDLLDTCPHLTGLEIRARPSGATAGAPPTAVFSIGSSMGPNMKGAVEPVDGFAVGDRRVGYGMGQTSIDFGDGNRVGRAEPEAMIKVTFVLAVGSQSVEVVASFLAERPTDPPWRAGVRASYRPTPGR